ncbi:lactosylceramide 4-alpha-galactosyltransferase [Diabrotica virgifera virgifera]|uniref:Alpha 1,4-glycosyltransferase domain-containing protein n=1 Tax=Diabrotica virgifera virgifera TaxID=50390 RepID=A0ABM5ITC3_DIAVI|nr:lactosylceramide 4-alpha-galactosyltransferase [Diabrotica virgifera virgifera]XP_028141313.2 lactosylceramide 4-alpha-galactosyltransferase [Diabrotica virgifera virgifera]XP_028141314.2 lactosylceramide 4-alpha-galactosyltransferase [Diabrotica virgifera virgifera]XP_028141315.2 lactosylceramide 4-alpha-galactosyltransferase [Diabrotica virgifera virgifera]XP_050501997.1 lactosylceramide 4-alpha-galactosyltransferase [Diabrotica virgifera virgifera]XP_050501998.1 lactosylceramide 4-alpha-
MFIKINKRAWINLFIFVILSVTIIFMFSDDHVTEISIKTNSEIKEKHAIISYTINNTTKTTATSTSTTTNTATATSISTTPSADIHCYRETSLASLPDISEISPRPGKSIFFHETSCKSFNKGKITINSRQACAVESAARLNPDLDIYVLYSSPGLIKSEGDESDKFLNALQSYKNVKIMHLDYGKYTKGTPVEELYSSGKIEKSQYVVSHASDVLRFLSLWKYGGYYFDLDVVHLKPIQDLPLSFAGVEADVDLGSAALSFSPDGIGHELAEQCLEDLRQSFDGNAWATNGPGVITRVLKKHCNVTQASDWVDKKCVGVTIYPASTFFAIPYQSNELFFDKNFLPLVKDQTKDSYIFHAWNKLSEGHKISVKTDVPYLYFARRYCTKVVAACNQYF